MVGIAPGQAVVFIVIIAEVIGVFESYAMNHPFERLYYVKAG